MRQGTASLHKGSSILASPPLLCLHHRCLYMAPLWISGVHNRIGIIACPLAAIPHALTSSFKLRRGVVAWRRWLMQKAGGGPEYAEGGAVGDPFRDSLGKLRRRELLDRFSQHTQHCAACSQVPIQEALSAAWT